MRHILGITTIAILLGGLAPVLCPPLRADDEVPTKINNQNRSGQLPFSATIGTGIENVDIASGNLLINIPIAEIPGRGMNLGFSLRYGARFLVMATRFNQQIGYYHVWNVEKDQSDLNSVGLLTVGWGTSQTEISYGTVKILCWDDLGTETSFMTVHAGYMLRDSTGAKHPFAYQTATGCPPSVTDNNMPDLGGNGMRASSGGAYPTIRLGDGTKRVAGPPIVWTDPNGNQRGEAPGGTDTLGRVPISKQNGVNSIQYKVFDSNGVQRTYTVNFTNITMATQFNVSGPYGPAVEFSSSRKVVSSVVLPNGRSYAFQYNSAYGEITRIDLPEGGVVTFTWAKLADGHKTHRYVSSRTVTVNGQSSTWTFSRSGSGDNISVTMTDPDTNQSVYQVFAGAVTSAKFYSGTATGTPLREYAMTYAWDADPLQSFNSYNPPSEPAKVGMRLVSIKTILETGLVSEKTFTYDSFTYDFHNCLEAGCYDPGTHSWPVSQYTTSRGNVLEIKEYDWGQGSPGPLARRTTNTYLHDSDTNYTNQNIVNKLLKESIYSGGGSKKTETQYEYDSTALTATSGVPQHDYSFYSSGFTTRGNPTRIKRWRNTDQALPTTTYIYDDLGNILSITDPLTHTTNYSYTDSWGGGGCQPPSNSLAYVTEATNHLGHRVQSSYYPCTGLRQSRRDENDIAASRAGVTSSYDFLGRLTQQNFPDGGHQSFNYNDVPPVSVTTTEALSATQNLVTVQTLDGLGRVTQQSLASDPQGTVYTDTAYDGLGRKQTVTNPYRSTGEATYGVTEFRYDALSRVTKVIPPDGTESANNVTTEYSGNLTQVYDQAGKWRKSYSDALGRLIQVDEFTGGAGTPATPGEGSVVVSGSLQSIPGGSGTPGTGSVTISGSGQLVTPPNCPPFKPNCLVADNGYVSITVASFIASVDYELLSTSSSIAAALAGVFNGNPSSPVTATAIDSTVYLTAKTTGSSTNYPLSTEAWSYVTGESSTSFTPTPSGPTLTGGSGGGSTVYDSGTVWIRVNSLTKTVTYGQGSTSSSIATALRSLINADSGYPVTAGGTGGTVMLTAKTTGASTNYPLAAGTTYDTVNFANPSFPATPSGSALTGGSDGSPGGSFATTNYTYDVLDNLLTVVQSGSRQRTFTYNSLSQLLSANNPESGTTTYTYDNDGNLLTKTDARSITTTYAYDALHRLTQKSYSDATPTVRYGYDGVAPAGCTPPTLTFANKFGLRTQMCDAGGGEAWSYDSMGRAVADRRTTNSVTQQFNYTYNLDGSVATLTYPSGRVITYAYNAAGRGLSAVDAVNSINYATAAAYAPQGGLASLVNGGTLTTKQYYNNRLQPCRISISTGTTPADCASATVGSVFDLAYNFDSDPAAGTQNNGNVGSITNKRDTNRTQSFTYDALNRLASAQSQAASGQHCWGLSYGYDIWANLLTATVTKCSAPSLSLAVGNNNRITTIGYAYDLSGNMTTVAGISGSLVYNAENQMTSAAGVTHYYDGDGRRVRKHAAGGQGSGNRRLYFYGLGAEVLVETDHLGALQDEYVFFNGQRTARRTSAGTVYYFFGDHLGSARVVTNATGSIVEESDYYPFGGERVITDTLNNNYKFTGKERDTESGLDYFIARHYSSTIGRFLQSDPENAGVKLENPQSWNAYAYSLNNPIRFVDPNGEDSVDFLVGTLQGIGQAAFGAVVGAIQMTAALESSARGNPVPLTNLTIESATSLSEDAGHLATAVQDPSTVADAAIELGDQEVGRAVGAGAGIIIVTLTAAEAAKLPTRATSTTASAGASETTAIPKYNRAQHYGNPSTSSAAKAARSAGEGRPCPGCGKTMSRGTKSAPTAEHQPSLKSHYYSEGHKLTSQQRRAYARGRQSIKGAKCKTCQSREGAVEARRKK